MRSLIATIALAAALLASTLIPVLANPTPPPPGHLGGGGDNHAPPPPGHLGGGGSNHAPGQQGN